jgi:hypothetical protein
MADATRIWVCSDFSSLRGMQGNVVFVAKDNSVFVKLDGLDMPMRFEQRELQHVVAA